MDHERQASIRKLVADEQVKHIQLWFTDILGNLKMVEIPDRQLDSVVFTPADRGLFSLPRPDAAA